MSVRDGLLAILSLGPAYGSQLHAEFASRAPHRGPVNVGQIYQTLDRLEKQKLVEPAGTTDDALPLYRLTASGSTAVSAWLAPAEPPLLDWVELLDRVIIAATLDPAAARRLVGVLRGPWESELTSAADAAADSSRPDAALAASARRELASAALAWLDVADESLRGLRHPRPYDPTKPRRGRRPGQPAGA